MDLQLRAADSEERLSVSQCVGRVLDGSVELDAVLRSLNELCAVEMAELEPQVAQALKALDEFGVIHLPSKRRAPCPHLCTISTTVQPIEGEAGVREKV